MQVCFQAQKTRKEAKTVGNIKLLVKDWPEGGEATIRAMDQYERAEIGRKTLRFVQRCMRNPELRARIQARAAEIRANGEYGCGK